MKPSILIIDDSEPIRTLLTEMLSSRGYEVASAADGREGLDYFNKMNLPVVITDLEMPVMEGKEFITNIKGIDEDVVIIVLTVHNEPQVIIDVMKMDVYDYIIKPVKKNELYLKVERAFETAELRRMKKTLEKGKDAKLQDQLFWFQFNEKVLKKDTKRIEKTLIENLHRSLTMGAGVGAVISILNLISMSAEKKDDKYIIDSELFEIVKENVRIAENSIKIFSDINKIINEKIEFESVTLKELYDLINQVIADSSKYAEIKSHKIVMNDFNESYKTKSLNIHKRYIKDVFKELLINAMKFSTESSTIMVIIEVRNEILIISVVNTQLEYDNEIRGIPLEYEKLVFEPFFKISKKISPGYDSWNYGLGLTFVEKIIEKHKGKIEASNLKDFTIIDSKSVDKVSITLELPLKK